MKQPLFICIITILTLSVCSPSDEKATVIFPNGESVLCEITDTPEGHAIGLSKHASLAPESGMLFVYPGEQPLSFWMPPEMQFSLDMIFLDKEWRVIHIEHNAPPCPDPSGYNCPSYGPGRRLGMYVVEVVAGKTEQVGLKEGDLLQIQFPPGYKAPDYR